MSSAMERVEASCSNEAVEFPVFVDEKGNAFVLPTVYKYKEKSISWDWCRMACFKLGVTEDKERFKIVPDDEGMLNFPHVIADAASPGFYFGGEEVWIIRGPKFDEVARDDQ